MLTKVLAAAESEPGFYDKVFSNLYITLLLMLIIMVATAVLNRRNQSYYNFKSETMQRHILNTKYQLNQRINVDLDNVNAIISYYNIGAAVLSFLIGAALHYFGSEYNFALTVAAVVFLVLTFVVHFASCYHVGRIYGNNKLRK